MFFNQTNSQVAVVSGIINHLSNYPEAMIASQALGDGYTIKPSEGTVVSPMDGEISLVFPTGHAYGLVGKDQFEVLIHIGVDTVLLNGQGFEVKVSVGQQVKAGQILGHFDMTALAQNPDVKALDVAVLFTQNKHRCEVLKPLTQVRQGETIPIKVVKK